MRSVTCPGNAISVAVYAVSFRDVIDKRQERYFLFKDKNTQKDHHPPTNLLSSSR